jgi:hypothetical protein
MMLVTVTQPPKAKRRWKTIREAENFLICGKTRKLIPIRNNRAINLETRSKATMPGNRKPQNTPTKGNKNDKELEGTLTAFTRLNRCKASKHPENELEIRTTGIAGAST